MDKRVIRFDGWKVDFSSGEISKDGATHRLQDQPLQILDELVANAGEVVTREQLIARLWPKGVVEYDTGLNSAMRKLRIALGDDAETPRYIETLPRKGYRFIGKLVDETAATIPQLPKLLSDYKPTPFETGLMIGRRASDRRAPYKRLALGFGSILAAVLLSVWVWRMPGTLFQSDPPPTPLPTVVVLPFVDMSVAQNEQALCDGLTEELANWLAHIPTLRVVARTSAFAFKGENLDVRQIAQTLGATHVLEGSLRRSQDQLRITVQLIEAGQGLHVWSDSYDLPLGNIFNIEDTVSRAVAEALHLQLSPDTARQWAERRSDSTNGFELYLLARERQRLRTAEDNLRAAQYFRRAIEADPDYTPALTGLAETLLNGLSLNRTPLEDVKAEVEPLINRAMTLSPEAAHVLAVKGWLLTEEYKTDEALPLLRRAIKANPNDAASHRFLGILHERMAQPNEALAHFSASAGLDPLDFLPQVFRCIQLTEIGQLVEATAACQRARELDPNHMWGPLATAWIDRAQGNSGGALVWIDQARRIAPKDIWLADQKIELLLALGKSEEAFAVMRELPSDGSFFSLAREASLVYSDQGPRALRGFLNRHEMRDRAGTGGELAELARLQVFAGDSTGAKYTLAHAQRMLPSSIADLYDGSQIKHEYSAALIQARIELAGGDRERANNLLAQMEKLLDTYERNGGKHFGLYSLRSELYALRGDKKKAEAALNTAWNAGWRNTWKARHDPYLDGVTVPGASAAAAAPAGR